MSYVFYMVFPTWEQIEQVVSFGMLIDVYKALGVTSLVAAVQLAPDL